MIFYSTNNPEGLHIKYKEFKYFYISIKDAKDWIKRYNKYHQIISGSDIQNNINSAIIAMLAFILLERK